MRPASPGPRIHALRSTSTAAPTGPYRTVKEALADPQLVHRSAMQEVHDAAGPFKVLNPAFRMSASETKAGPHSPALGEHTREVLAAAGYSESEIAAITGT